MSTKRNDISQITNYLKGKLNSRAMHGLERAAQDDPFLMNALEGYETTGNDIQADINELKHRLDECIASKKRRKLLLWRVIPIAASLLLTIGVSLLFIINNKPEKPQLPHVAQNIVKTPDTPEGVSSQTSAKLLKSAPIQRHKSLSVPSSVSNDLIAGVILPKQLSRAGSVRRMIDTVSYKAAVYKAKKNMTIEGLIKKMSTITIDNNPLIAKNNNQFYGSKVNGKEFSGGSVQQAIKNLPADILGKIQIVNDYGDQASKKGQNITLNSGITLPSKTATSGIHQKSDQIIPIPFKIGGTEVRDNPVGNVEELLQGKVANLNIQNNVGAPGLRGSVNIRGLSNDTSHGDPVIRGYVKRNGKTGQNNISKELPDNPISTTPEHSEGNGKMPDIHNQPLIGSIRGVTNIRGLPTIPDEEAPPIKVPIGYHIISGQVIDSASAMPLQYATIGMFGRGLTYADRYGMFKLAVPPKGEFYVFLAGYKGRMIEIDGNTKFSIRLKLGLPRSENGYNLRNKLIDKPNLAHIKKAVIKPRAPGDTTCHENVKFRDKFWGSVGIIFKRGFEEDNGMVITVSDRQYRKAQKFLAGYIDLNESAYEWYNWYNANKCNNLK